MGFFTLLAFTTLVAVKRNRLYPVAMLLGVVVNIGLNLLLIPENHTRNTFYLSNVAQLQQVWRFDAGSEGGLQTQPLVIGRTLFGYTTDQHAIALDGATGALLWFTGAERQTPIPSAVVAEGLVDAVMERVVTPTLAEMTRRGTPPNHSNASSFAKLDWI